MKLQKEAASELDVLDMVANPMRFVRREEIEVKVRSLMPGVAGRRVRARMGKMRDGVATKKKEKGVTVVIQTSLATDT
jgi:hypothetical protein